MHSRLNVVRVRRWFKSAELAYHNPNTKNRQNREIESKRHPAKGPTGSNEIARKSDNAGERNDMLLIGYQIGIRPVVAIDAGRRNLRKMKSEF